MKEMFSVQKYFPSVARGLQFAVLESRCVEQPAELNC
jgi:hypothetical protein